MIARCYTMSVTEGHGDELARSLQDLSLKILRLAGAVRVDIMRRQNAGADFLFLETWDSAEAAKSGGAMLGREAFASVVALLAAPPVTTQYQVL